MSPEHRSLEARLRRLQYAVVGLLILICGAGVTAFSTERSRTRFNEIDVQRINIVEGDGTVRMTISNREKSPGWVIGGKPRAGRPKNAGMIFFNDQGEEDGGLIYGSTVTKSGYNASLSLSFDQRHADQVVALQHMDENGVLRQGLAINEFPPPYSLAAVIARRDSINAMPPGPARTAAEAQTDSAQARGEYGANRAYFGRDKAGNAILRLSDKTGKARVRLLVDSLGDARLEFLDAAGQVVNAIRGQH